jgi:transcriptional regulator with XRE-family HTH domain
VANRQTPSQAFGANVKRLRQAAGLSQEALAAKAGVHRTYLGSAERGERNVSLDNICRIAAALCVAPSALLDGVKTQGSARGSG